MTEANLQLTRLSVPTHLHLMAVRDTAHRLFLETPRATVCFTIFSDMHISLGGIAAWQSVALINLKEALDLI